MNSCLQLYQSLGQNLYCFQFCSCHWTWEPNKTHPIFMHKCGISALRELCSVSQHCCVFLFPSVSRVLLKQKGKPPPGPPVQQPRGLASLFGQKQETPKLFKAMLGGKGKEGLAKLLQLKRQQETRVKTQKTE